MTSDPALMAQQGAGQDSSEVPLASGVRSWVRDLWSLTKPRLSLLVIITAAGGLWLSNGTVSGIRSVLIVLSTAMVVGGANALNNYLERDTDRLMSRTRVRALPEGRLRPRQALVFGVILTAVSVPTLTIVGTPLAGFLAGLAFVLYVFVYTPLKRRSSINTLVGAVPGAMPPLIGWTAVTGTLDTGGLTLFALLFLWQIPHSLAIAIFRKSDYERAGLMVFPVEHGEHATRLQMLLYTMPLAVLPLLMVHQGIAGIVTLVLGTGLGSVFLWLCFQGFKDKEGAKWARRVFLFSLVHLTSVFAALSVDQWWLAGF